MELDQSGLEAQEGTAPFWFAVQDVVFSSGLLSEESSGTGLAKVRGRMMRRIWVSSNIFERIVGVRLYLSWLLKFVIEDHWATSRGLWKTLG